MARRTAGCTFAFSGAAKETATRSFSGGRAAASANGRSGAGMASGSPSSGPETTSSHSAVSATRRDTQPATLSACQWTGSGVNGTRPRWVFNPTRPLQEAGIRIEPPPSVAGAGAALGLLGLDAGPLGEHHPEGVQPRVDALDALEIQVDQLAWRDLARAYQLSLAGWAGECQLGRVHGRGEIISEGASTPYLESSRMQEI